MESESQDLLLDMDIFVKEHMLYVASVSDDKTCQIFRVRVLSVCWNGDTCE